MLERTVIVRLVLVCFAVAACSADDSSTTGADTATTADTAAATDATTSADATTDCSQLTDRASCDGNSTCQSILGTQQDAANACVRKNTFAGCVAKTTTCSAAVVTAPAPTGGCWQFSTDCRAAIGWSTTDTTCDTVPWSSLKDC